MDARAARGPALVATAVAVPVALLVGVAVFWFLRPEGEADAPEPTPTATVSVAAPPSLAEAVAPCQGLLAQLPSHLDGHGRRPVSADPERVTAWGEPPIVLRCGVGKPAAFTDDAQLFGVNGVDWVADEGDETVVWTTVSLKTYVELRVPDHYREKTATRLLNPLAAPLRRHLS